MTSLTLALTIAGVKPGVPAGTLVEQGWAQGSPDHGYTVFHSEGSSAFVNEGRVIEVFGRVLESSGKEVLKSGTLVSPGYSEILAPLGLPQPTGMTADKVAHRINFEGIGLAVVINDDRKVGLFILHRDLESTGSLQGKVTGEFWDYTLKA